MIIGATFTTSAWVELYWRFLRKDITTKILSPRKLQPASSCLQDEAGVIPWFRERAHHFHDSDVEKTTPPYWVSLQAVWTIINNGRGLKLPVLLIANREHCRFFSGTIQHSTASVTLFVRLSVILYISLLHNAKHSHTVVASWDGRFLERPVQS